MYKTAFSIGDPALIIGKKRKWLVNLTLKNFHCNAGSVPLAEIIGKAPGLKIQTSLKNEVTIVRPTALEAIRYITHQSQIIYEKDLALISHLVGASPGKVIYEAGTGSGALTSVLSTLVGTTGKIITHEVRESALDIAKENLLKLACINVEFNLCDVQNGFATGKADGIVLDLAEPWGIISNCLTVLTPGSPVVIFALTINQLEKCYYSLEQYNFTGIKAVELLERELKISKGAVRPVTNMIGHTGYIVSARAPGE